jgi:hypothetical protein
MTGRGVGCMQWLGRTSAPYKKQLVIGDAVEQQRSRRTPVLNEARSSIQGNRRCGAGCDGERDLLQTRPYFRVFERCREKRTTNTAASVRWIDIHTAQESLVLLLANELRSVRLQGTRRRDRALNFSALWPGGTLCGINPGHTISRTSSYLE